MCRIRLIRISPSCLETIRCGVVSFAISYLVFYFQVIDFISMLTSWLNWNIFSNSAKNFWITQFVWVCFVYWKDLISFYKYKYFYDNRQERTANLSYFNILCEFSGFFLITAFCILIHTIFSKYFTNVVLLNLERLAPVFPQTYQTTEQSTNSIAECRCCFIVTYFVQFQSQVDDLSGSISLKRSNISMKLGAPLLKGIVEHYYLFRNYW